MKFSDFICFEAIVPELEAKDRDGAILELVSALDAQKKLGGCSCNEIVKMVISRENEGSTGMGKGVAMPHIKHPALKNVIATVGVSGNGIDFASLDKQPVHSIILLLSPSDDPDKHLQAIESVFKHLQKERFRKFLKQAENAEQIEELLKEADENSLL